MVTAAPAWQALTRLRSTPSSVCGKEPIVVIGKRAAGIVGTAGVAKHGNAARLRPKLGARRIAKISGSRRKSG